VLNVDKPPSHPEFANLRRIYQAVSGFYGVPATERSARAFADRAGTGASSEQIGKLQLFFILAQSAAKYEELADQATNDRSAQEAKEKIQLSCIAALEMLSTDPAMGVRLDQFSATFAD
jgi:hypothetical protein